MAHVKIVIKDIMAQIVLRLASNVQHGVVAVSLDIAMHAQMVSSVQVAI
jgi:hypothetical protein